MTTKDKILIVQQADVAKKISKILRRVKYDIFTAETFKSALEQMSNHHFQLVLLDVSLPDGSGYDFCREIKAVTNTQVLFFTEQNETKDKVLGIDCGCDYYMSESENYEELVAIVESLIRRKKKNEESGQSFTRLGPLELNFKTSSANINGIDLQLTRKEFLLLTILVDNLNTPISSEVLYEKVWNMPMHDNASALWAQLSRLRKKLDKFMVFELVNDRKNGYYLEFIK